MNFHSSKAAAFGQQRLELACRKAGISVSVELVRDSGLPAQAYRLTRLQDRLRLSAGDEEAAMTALLDLADSVEALQGPPPGSEQGDQAECAAGCAHSQLFRLRGQRTGQYRRHVVGGILARSH